jgi:hypothetical protein
MKWPVAVARELALKVKWALRDRQLVDLAGEAPGGGDVDEHHLSPGDQRLQRRCVVALAEGQG